jgi:hypothetical protein
MYKSRSKTFEKIPSPLPVPHSLLAFQDLAVAGRPLLPAWVPARSSGGVAPIWWWPAVLPVRVPASSGGGAGSSARRRCRGRSGRAAAVAERRGVLRGSVDDTPSQGRVTWHGTAARRDRPVQVQEEEEAAAGRGTPDPVRRGHRYLIQRGLGGGGPDRRGSAAGLHHRPAGPARRRGRLQPFRVPHRHRLVQRKLRENPTPSSTHGNW